MEEAKENGEGLDLLSWDIRQAFDSVSQTLQYLAWRRIGIPQEIALWLVSLDQGGKFVVRTPYAQDKINKAWQDGDPEAFTAAMEEWGLTAEQGLTQGDVKSTLGWIATFDILLTALNILISDQHIKPYYVKHHGSFLYPQCAWAFADDLVTVTPDRESTILLGLFISLALAILGMRLATEKLRVLTSIRDRTPVVVYSWTGEPLLYTDPITKITAPYITFQDANHTIKILGIRINLNLNWDDAYDKLVTTLLILMETLQPRLGRLSTKLKLLPRNKQHYMWGGSPASLICS